MRFERESVGVVCARPLLHPSIIEMEVMSVQ